MFAYAEWDQQAFSVEASLTQKSTKLQNSQLYISSIDSELYWLKMFEGFAIRLNANAANNHFIDDVNTTGSTNHNYSSFSGRFASRLFLGPVSNLDLELVASNRYEASDFNLVRFLPESRSITHSNEKLMSVKWHIGSADESRTLDVGVDVVDNKYAFRLYEESFKEFGANKLALDYSDQISEDTHWLFSYGLLDAENQFVDVLKVQNVNNVLIGFTTAYFGNSRLRVLIGNSHQKNKDDQSEKDSLSWVAENTLAISEDLEFRLTTKREFNTSPDPSFSSSLVSDFSALLTWQISHEVRLDSNISYKLYDFSGLKEADLLSWSNNLEWWPLEQLAISLTLNLQKFDGSQQAYKHDGINAGANVTWEVW